MCPRTNTYKHYLFCGLTGHKIPSGACNHYAPGLQMCLDDPSGLRKFNLRKMNKKLVWDYCRFCKEGRDIDGDFLYGETWQGASRWRERRR
ncbi:hypothetical protein SVAN01_10028 [Stagonosporopsis vannaccii]|nr:hypothetical protein SVAN01_10028 [Stagonosporopsis vannaccii]